MLLEPQLLEGSEPLFIRPHSSIYLTAEIYFYYTPQIPPEYMFI